MSASVKLTRRALPTARDVRDRLGRVEIGGYVVFHDTRPQAYAWKVKRKPVAIPADHTEANIAIDRNAETLDEFKTYREAVGDARRRERADVLKRRADYHAISSAAPKLLAVIDEVLADVIASYRTESSVPLERMNDWIWSLLRVACIARGQKVPTRIPDEWDSRLAALAASKDGTK